MISLPAFAQNHFIGLKTGANLTNVVATDFLFQTENKIGFNAAITYECMFNEHFSLGVDAQ